MASNTQLQRHTGEISEAIVLYITVIIVSNKQTGISLLFGYT